jgi:Tfp pilus assembly protein PilF
MISQLEKLLGTPRDGALLRYSLGTEYLKAGERERGIAALREAVARDPQYSAAWKALGKASVRSKLCARYTARICGKQKATVRPRKEMTVLARRGET